MPTRVHTNPAPASWHTRSGYLFRRKRVGGKVRYFPVDADVDAKISFSYNAFGVTKVVSTGTKDKAQAEIFRRRYLGSITAANEEKHLRGIIAAGEAAKRQLYGAGAARQVLLSNAWETYVQSKRRPESGASTMRGYKHQCARFVQWVPSNVRTLDQVTPELCEQYVTAIERGDPEKKRKPMGRSSCKQHIGFLRLMFRILQPGAQNPWEGLHPTATSKAVPYRRLSVKECRDVISSAAGEWKTLLLIGYSTGMRLADACLLEWRSVNLRRRTIAFVPKKTANTAGTVATVPVIRDLAQVLRRLTQAGNYVLPEIARLYIRDQSSVSKRIVQIFEKAGVKDTAEGRASFHSFRVTWQSINDDAGTSRVFIRQVLAHRSPSMSDTYSRLDTNRVRKAVDKAMPRVT